MRFSAGLAAAAVGSALLTLHAHSQDPVQPQTPPTFRGGIDVVQMDVSVLDKDRRPVRGLTASDFTIVSDNEPQPIVQFEAVDIPDVETTGAAWTRDAGMDVSTNDRLARRIIVIVFDDAHMPLDKTDAVKRIARDIVERLGPDDLAAVTFTDSGRRQDVTYDHQRLLAAIDSVVPHPFGLAGPVSSRRAREPMGGLGCAYRGASRSASSCVVDTLVTASKALLEAPQGRKTLVYISTGPGFPGASFEEIAAMSPEAPPEHPTQQFEEMMAIRETLDNLQRANVNVYAINPMHVTGVAGPDTWSGIFADGTGGRAFTASNTPWIAVPEIFREISSYYLIGFRPTHLERDGSFQRVRIRVNREGLEVRARTGFFAPRAARSGQPTPEVAPLDRAINRSMPGGELPLASTLVPIAVPGQKNAAVAIATLVREPLGSGTQTIEVVTRALDSDCGECRRLPSSKQVVSFTARPGQGEARGEVLSKLSLPPGSYEIRIAASSNDRVGSVLTHVDVPDFGKEKLAASGLALAAAQSVATAERQMIAGLIPIVPTAAREFARSTTVTAFLRLYQLGVKAAGSVKLTATILDARGDVALSDVRTIERTAFGQTKSADYRIYVPVARLEPGAYLLSIDASAGPAAIKRETRFWVK